MYYGCYVCACVLIYAVPHITTLYFVPLTQQVQIWFTFSNKDAVLSTLTQSWTPFTKSMWCYRYPHIIQQQKKYNELSATLKNTVFFFLWRGQLLRSNQTFCKSRNVRTPSTLLTRNLKLVNIFKQYCKAGIVKARFRVLYTFTIHHNRCLLNVAAQYTETFAIDRVIQDQFSD